MPPKPKFTKEAVAAIALAIICFSEYGGIAAGGAHCRDEAV